MKTTDSFSVPTHLRHKPVFAINHYSAIDGPNKNDTDVVGLSFGSAQWDTGKKTPSVKVWRRSKSKWSRQSEETTITRALDMAMLVVNVLDHQYNGTALLETPTVYGTVKIEKTDVPRETFDQLNTYLVANQTDIMEHVKLLQASLERFAKNCKTQL